ncbi:hypothetical protein LCGC14_2656140 [marine sediment metagenome]|uniref:Uncharacterized protein n=1 Tax=marine sediment metagenome TaxID=412755 RepID=A0A0F9C3Q4_9ZZZZ
MKEKKLIYRIGNLDWITIPNDWRKADGIKAKRTETNMGLAQRDYSVKCKTGTEPLMVVEGFWIWWCHTHNQPEKWCSEKRLKIGFYESLDKLKKEQEEN